MTAWKVATLVFGASLAVLLARELIDADAQRRAARERHADDAASDAGDRDGGDRAAAAAQQKSAITKDDLPEDPVDYVLSLVPMYPGQEFVRLPDERRLALLRARADDVEPVLERWMRRIPTEGHEPYMNPDQLCLAYAAVAGGRGVPLLEDVAGSEIRRAAIRSLGGIDDPAAVAALERIQARAAPDLWLVRPQDLIRHGSGETRAMARRWARAGPPNNPELAIDVRAAFFHLGDESERDAMLALAGDRERERLLLEIDPAWGAQWRTRLIDHATRLLRSNDADGQLAACRAIAERRGCFDEAIRDEAAVHVRLRLADPPPDKQRFLEGLLRSLEREREDRENRARWREELRR